MSTVFLQGSLLTREISSLTGCCQCWSPATSQRRGADRRGGRRLRRRDREHAGSALTGRRCFSPTAAPTATRGGARAVPREAGLRWPAARVVRALIDFAPALLSARTRRALRRIHGRRYRVVELLEHEGAAYPPTPTARSGSAWRALLTRWSEDYGLAQSNPVSTLPWSHGGFRHSSERLPRRLADWPVRADRFAGRRAPGRPYAPARLAMLYVDDPDRARETLRGCARPPRAARTSLFVTAATGQLRLRSGSETADDLRVDRGPRRSRSTCSDRAGTQPQPRRPRLLDWMEANEPVWRGRPSRRRAVGCCSTRWRRSSPTARTLVVIGAQAIYLHTG